MISCTPDAPEWHGGIRNVVVISLDALGATHAGAYGYPRDTTPRLDALAREGTLFERAYSPQVWTLTSHLTMMTGLHPQVHGASHKRPAREGVETLAERLSSAGFETAAFVGTGGYMDARFGLGRGFARYEVLFGPAHRTTTRRIEWLEEQAERQRKDPRARFFLFAHYYDVHSDFGTRVPYDSPPEFARRYWPEGLVWDRSGDTQLLIEMEKAGDVTEADRQAVTALYDGSVRYCDEHCLGRLLDGLEELGLASSTLVVVTSDHGEEIFEHGMCSHQQPYEETARVPLVVRGPGIAAGHQVGAIAGLVDLTPTILSLLGLDAPAAVQGHDWADALGGTPGTAPRRAYVDGIFGGLPDVYWGYPSAVIGDEPEGRFSAIASVAYTLLGTPDASAGRATPAGVRRYRFSLAGPVALFDLRADPNQRVDIAAERPEIADRLGRALIAWYEENEERRVVGGADAPPATFLDAEERERLRALGYVHDDVQGDAPDD
jgi:arylsulfatase A-like enzyme